MRRLAPLLGAVAAVAVVIGSYLALGGATYEPAPVADPCASRPTPRPEGLAHTVEYVALEALDKAACELGVGREELVLALRDEDAFGRFAAANGVTRDEAERAVKDGLSRAIDDAQEEGELPGLVASLASGALDRVPPWLLLETIERLGGLLG